MNYDGILEDGNALICTGISELIENFEEKNRYAYNGIIDALRGKSTERLDVIAHQYKGRYKMSEGSFQLLKRFSLLQLGLGSGVLKISFQDIKNSRTPEF